VVDDGASAPYRNTAAGREDQQERTTAEDRTFYLKKAINQKKKARGLILVE
jgi:hypothetical protein